MASDPKWLALAFVSALAACEAQPRPYLAPCRDQESQLVRLYERYAAARKDLAASAAATQSLTPEEWSGWLKPEAECRLQPSSVSSLQARHRQLIRQARIEAGAHPELELGRIRSDGAQVRSFCREFPKGAILRIQPREGGFSEGSLSELARRAASQGIHYVEASETLPMGADGIPTAEVLEKADALASRLQSETGVTFRWKLLFQDGNPAGDSAAAAIRKLDELIGQHRYPKSLVGTEMIASGPTEGQRWLKASAQFLKHAELPLKHRFRATAAHDLVRDSIVAGANSILLSDQGPWDPVTLEWVRRQGVLLIVRAEPHELLTDYVSLGIPVVFAGGDPDSPDFDLAAECVSAVSSSDLAYGELKQIAFNSIQKSDADAETQGRLSDELKKSFAEFEGRWKGRLLPTHR